MSLTSLLCEESREHGINHLSEYYDDDYQMNNDEFVEILLSREINSSSIRPFEGSDTALNNLRNDAVNYIFNIRAALGFQFQTAYLSLCYFDLFLSKRSIDDENTWTLQLLSVACLSLAAKLEEHKVPSLSQFQVGPYNFQGKIVQKMELLVLNTLEWKMGLVTPFAYFPCFIYKIYHGPPPKGTISRIIKLLLAIVREVNLMDHHNYSIACASILVALDQGLSRTAMASMINTIPSSTNFDMEDIFTCYNIMKQLELDRNEELNLPDSRALLSPVDVLLDSRPPSHYSKRKRLEFHKVDDLNNDATSEKKPRRCC